MYTPPESTNFTADSSVSEAIDFGTKPAAPSCSTRITLRWSCWPESTRIFISGACATIASSSEVPETPGEPEVEHDEVEIQVLLLQLQRRFGGARRDDLGLEDRGPGRARKVRR